MKKNIAKICITLMALTCSCHQFSDDIYTDNIRRVSEQLEMYSNYLVDAEGWKGFLYPSGGKAFTFFFSFDRQGRVKMLSDLSGDAARDFRESTYRIDMFQSPTLAFDTYSYIHMLSDPDSEILDGELGHGYYSDFEFTFDSVTSNYIRLKGSQHGSKLVLIKVNAAEATEFEQGELARSMNLTSSYLRTNSNLFLIDEQYKKTAVSLNVTNRTIALVTKENGVIHVKRSTFSYIPGGIHIDSLLTYGDFSFSEVHHDVASNKMYIQSPQYKRIDCMVNTNPIFSMHEMLGVQFNTIVVPNGPIDFPGWSEAFQAYWYATNNALNNCCGLMMGRMKWTFNTTSQQLTLEIFVDVPAGGSFRLYYPMRYTKTPTGIFDFRMSENEDPNLNAQYLEPIMGQLVSHFLEKQFTMEYFTTSKGVVGQLSDIDYDAYKFSGVME